MDGIADSINLKTVKSSESVFLQTIRLIINLVTIIFLFMIVFVSLLFSCKSTKLTVFDLHIILCVLGYQFFMCQGILVLSQYNGWSMLIKRRHRKHFHWILQMLAIILVITGSVIMIKEKHTNLNTAHGILALCALVLCILSFLNGALLHKAHTFNSSEKVITIKYTHYVTSISALFCSTAALCFGFNAHSFKTWMANDNAVKSLIIITWLFTITVSIDFWISLTSRMKKLFP